MYSGCCVEEKNYLRILSESGFKRKCSTLGEEEEKSSQPSFNLTYIHHHFHASCSPAGVEVCLSLSTRVTARDFVCGGGECQSALANLIANAELDGIIVEAKVCRFSRTGL